MRITRIAGQAHEELCEKHDAIAVSLETLHSVEEAELALHLAEEAFRKGKNIAKKKKLEFLLWLSGTTDIKNALKKTKPGKEYFLISFPEKPGVDAHGLAEKGDSLRLERISLSRI
jgi:tRNA threonylcarbamoyladenosine modification (KEOPS) complex Cgi121 subunit